MNGVSDKDWFAIRETARRRDWDGVARRAEALGWPLVARRARMLPFDPELLPGMIWTLRLDLPDEHYLEDAEPEPPTVLDPTSAGHR